MKDFIFKINSAITGYFKKYFKEHPYKSHINLMLLFSLLIVFIVQSFECRSVLDGFGFVFKNTYFFILNFLIVLITLSVAFLFKRRHIVILLFSVLWVALGFANFLVISNRPMPMSAIDFVIMKTTMDIIPHYFTVFHVILCVVAIILGIALFVVMFIKAKKQTRTAKQAVLPLICSTILMLVFTVGGSANGSLKISYNDVTAAYDEHGFIYCFTSSIFSKGIPKPDNYSSNNIKQIVEKYESVKSEKTITPNIIVVQLESFFDVGKYSKYSLNNDPIKNFHKICNKFGEGALIVPSNGGGTVNTEFEVLTGMNLEYFGSIEYPYTTILKDRTCESAPFILSNYGYTSHAIHNHTAVFYARNQVYPNLGFDTFTPLEYMQYENETTGWAKDSAIFDSITESLDSTNGNDFIFAVTVQGHGAYSGEENPNNKYKVISNDDETISNHDLKKAYMYEHYCNLISETDEVIGNLYDYVMSSDENYVVVLYGDHLPSLDLDTESYEYGSSYMTTYTVFSNIEDFDYVFEKELPSHRLLSSVFEKLGIDEGIINKINRNCYDSNYSKELEEIQYDMLYGKGFSYNGKPYASKNIKFGCKDIIITDITFDDGFLTVRGKNFTKESVINVNGWERDTAFVDSETIVCACSKIDEDDIISVCQTAVDGTDLTETYFNYTDNTQ